MPVPTETLRDTGRLNKVFAFSAFLTLASTVWMFWHDYARPWRDMQTNYFNVRSAMAHFEVLRYETPEEEERRSKLLAAVEAAEKVLSAPKIKQRELELTSREQRLTGELQGAALTYGNMNAEFQVRIFDYEEARTLKGDEHPQTLKILRENEKAAVKLAKAKEKMDRIEDDLREVKTDLKAMYADRAAAQKALSAYDKGMEDAKRFEKMYGPGFMRTALNLPLLDYLAPQGTPGRQEVRQVFMKPIRFDYNFADSYVTDRCVTCHVGIDDPNLTVEKFVQRTERALNNPNVQRTLQQYNGELREELLRRLAEAGQEAAFAKQDYAEMDGQTRRGFIRALVVAANIYMREIKRPAMMEDEIQGAAQAIDGPTRSKVSDLIVARFERILWGRPPTAEGSDQPVAWKDMTEPQRMTYAAALTAAMNTYLADAGRPPIDFSKEVQAHPNLDLYVSPDSPHPMKTMGCTVCHEGAGMDTDFVLAAHTPRDKAQKKRWEEEYYVREAGIPLATFHLVEEFWERPMLVSEYTSASCRKCHQQTYDLERRHTLPLDSARRVVEGRDLFTTVGCINCHNVEGLTDYRQVGTDLAHVAQKLSPGFMERWVEYPKNFRPSTWMPHFFHQENNLPSSANEFDPEPVLRSETEIQSIVHYLRTFSKPLEMPSLPKGVEGDPKRGEDLFVSIGCLACHGNLDAKYPLSEEGKTIGEVWITQDLLMREGLSEEDAQSRYEAMSKNDRVRYAVQHLTPERREEALKTAAEEEVLADRERRDPDPMKLYLPPALSRVGPELSGIGTKLVDDPGDAEQAAKGRQWLYNWLRDPRHYASTTRMPRLFRDNYYQYDDTETREDKNDQDIMDVAAFLLSQRNDDFDRSSIPDDSAHSEMRASLIMQLLTGQNTESVSTKILNDEKSSESDAHGRLTAAVIAQAAASFGAGDEGRERVSRIIAEKSGGLEDRRKLFLGMKMISHYGCYACHNIAGFEGATRPGTDLTLWAQKFMSQLDFAFYSPAFEHEVEAAPHVFGKMYIESAEFEHLARDAGANEPVEVLHNHASFAYHKMRNPRIWDREKIKKPYEKLKMPNFFLSQDQARSVVTFLLSMRDANVAESVKVPYEKTPAGKIAKGRALARELNCIGCHTIEGNEATIHQYYTRDTSVSDLYPYGPRFKPPLLWGEGAKVQFDWLFKFLNNVEMLRPWLNARMPSFYLTKEQATILVEYFAGLSQDEAAMLHARLGPIHQYMAAMNGQETSPADAWFVHEKYAAQADVLVGHAVAKEQVRGFELSAPDATTPAEIAEYLGPTYEKIVRRGDFLAESFDVQFPFTDPELHAMDEKTFKTGEEFFYELKCLACHVAGDPSVPGTTTDIKAPNFALSHKRLRYDWIVQWLKDPQALMPGTNMPQIFPGTTYHAQIGGKAQEEGEGKYGDTLEKQAELLVDFIFNLGERSYTAIQPGGLEQPAAATQPAEDAEFDFDSGEEKKESQEDFDF